MEQKSYNKREQPIFILHALKIDIRFKDSLTYIESIIQVYPCESQVSVDTQFPLDLEIYEILVTIDERSDSYTVGDKAATPRVTILRARGK